MRTQGTTARRAGQMVQRRLGRQPAGALALGNGTWGPESGVGLALPCVQLRWPPGSCPRVHSWWATFSLLIGVLFLWRW